MSNASPRIRRRKPFLAGLVLGLLLGFAAGALLVWFQAVPTIAPMQGAVARQQVGQVFALPGVENDVFSLRADDRQLVVYVPGGADVNDLRGPVDTLLSKHNGLSVCYMVAPGALVDRQDMVLTVQCEYLTQADLRQKTPVWWLVDTDWRILCRGKQLSDIEAFLAAP